MPDKEIRVGEKEKEAGRGTILPGHRDTSPFQESHPDHSGAPHCSLIGPRAGAEEPAVTLQAAAGGKGLNQLFNYPMPTGGKDPSPVEPQGLYQKGCRTP